VQLRRDPSEGCGVVDDEAAAEEKVLGGVAGDRQLGEGDEVGTELARPAAVVDDLGGVAVEIADRRVDLGECDS